MDVYNETDQTVVIWRDATAVDPNATPTPVQTIKPGSEAPVTVGSEPACVEWAFEARTQTGVVLARRPAPACATDTWTIRASGG